MIPMLLGLSGCAAWRSLPLGEGRGAQLADLTLSANTMALPPPAVHPFNPDDGLDVTEVAMLAVANSPELKVKRDDLDVAQAQAFAAGLLPDPQVSLGVDHPTTSGQGLVNAFNLGVSYDFTKFLTRSARVSAARQAERQVHLELLWEEWQTIAKSRELFNSIVAERELAKRLRSEQAALDAVLPHVRRALAVGDLTYDSAHAGLNAGADVANRLADTTRKLNQAEHDLRALLGLAEQVPLNLIGPVYAPDYRSEEIDQALTVMTKRRPDLLALQAGYAAQDEKLREAILAQYPALTIGFNRARDTSSVYSSGFSVALNLPIFDRGRGNIAIETSNRKKLHDEYDRRVLTGRLDIGRLAGDLAQFRSERTRLIQLAAELDRARDAAQNSYSANLVDWPTYLAIRAAALSADTDLLTLDENRAQSVVALDTLVGGTRLNTPPEQEAKRK